MTHLKSKANLTSSGDDFVIGLEFLFGETSVFLDSDDLTGLVIGDVDSLERVAAFNRIHRQMVFVWDRTGTEFRRRNGRGGEE